MTYRDYMRDHTEENLSWCRPYRSGNGRVSVAVNDGEICGLIIDGQEIDLAGKWRISEQAPFWEMICKVSVEDADLLADEAELGYSPSEIALMDGLVECGCANCPFADLCDAMSEELGEDEED